MAIITSFDETILRSICNTLADTNNGLTGSEIGQILKACNIDDPCPGTTKRYRLFEALSKKQKQDRCANNVIAFICQAMCPVRYIQEQDIFERRRFELNKALAFAGFTLTEMGNFSKISAAQTLTEAQERANKLYKQLLSRNTHRDILIFCKAELLQDNYFHAVFEAIKSIADKIRIKSGLSTDGAKLIDAAFGGDYPLLVFNTRQTETERSEHKGYMNLLKGLFASFRNSLAHEPKIKWNINEQDAIDILTFTSFLHRKLDNCVCTKS